MCSFTVYRAAGRYCDALRCLHPLPLLLPLREKGLNSMLDEFLSFFSPSDSVCEAVVCTPILPATQFARLAIRHYRASRAGPGRAGTGTAEIYLV